MFNKIFDNKQNTILITIIISIVLLLIFSRYSGNHHSDHKNIWLFLDGNFQLDIYENGSLPIKTSIYYLILQKLNISMDNDNIGLLFHYFFSLISFVYIIKIIKKIFPDIVILDIIVIALSICVLDNFFLQTVRSGWIYHQATSSSQAGIAFFFYFVWQTLNFNRLKLFFSAPIFLLISIKVAWFPIGVALIYSYFKRKKLIDTWWIIPCIIFGISYLIKFYEPSNFEINLLLFNQIIEKEGNEVAIHLQKNTKIILSLSLFFIFYLFLRFFKKNNYSLLFKVIFVLSVMSFIFGFIYGKYGYLFYPNPKLLILNSVRSMYYIQFILAILYSAYVVKKFDKNAIKYLLLIMPFFLSYSDKTVMIAALFLILSIFIINLKVNNKIGLWFVILLIFAISINAVKNRYYKLDLHTYSLINHWSTHVVGNNELKSYLIELRKCNDFLMYDDIKMKSNAQFFANKSKYYIHRPQNILLNYSLLLEHKRRENIIESIKDNSYKSLAKLKKENFVYISQKSLNIETYNIKKPFAKLHFFFEDKNLNQVISNCPNLLD
jgi:hypothetical protein